MNPTPNKPDELLEKAVYEIWAIVKHDSLASSQIGYPSGATREAIAKYIQAHYIRRDEVLALLPEKKPVPPNEKFHFNEHGIALGWNNAINRMKSALQPDIREESFTGDDENDDLCSSCHFGKWRHTPEFSCKKFEAALTDTKQ